MMTLDMGLLFIGNYTQQPTVYSGLALWTTPYDSISVRCTSISPYQDLDCKSHDVLVNHTEIPTTINIIVQSVAYKYTIPVIFIFLCFSNHIFNSSNWADLYKPYTEIKVI